MRLGADDRLPTRARTLLFGKPALLALPALILRDAPPRNGATIGPLQGGRPWNRPRRIMHPLFVHLHIAFLLIAFIAMATWLVRGLATSVFEDRISRFAPANTWGGVVTVGRSMLAGLCDGLFDTMERS